MAEQEKMKVLTLPDISVMTDSEIDAYARVAWGLLTTPSTDA
jgi:hypothetical protein